MYRNVTALAAVVVLLLGGCADLGRCTQFIAQNDCPVGTAGWNARVNAEVSVLPPYVPTGSTLPTRAQILMKQ